MSYGAAMDKAWGGRFNRKESPVMEDFNSSLAIDQRLYRQDIAGSIAHAQMLFRIGILTSSEVKKITHGLKKIEAEINHKKFLFTIHCEDIHMAVESRLTEIIGPLGGKLHTARSRNDQINLDMRLFARDANNLIVRQINDLQRSIVSQAQNHKKTILPGYTHLQRAQPVLLAHHLLAYFEMLQRDIARFSDNLQRLKECPLGAGALAGTTINIDRKFVARELKFSDVTHNSLDTVADRDFILDILSACSILMIHLSRLAEELVLWSSQEFGFVKLPQEFCTGSSMMPQKINPDAPELIRGKTGRVLGNLMNLLTTLKALPLAYNKDLQEDKSAWFDSLDTCTACLAVMTALIAGSEFDQTRMMKATKEGFLLATDIADYLARKGVPFRKAHHVTGQLVQHAVKKKCGLEDLDLKTLQQFDPHFATDVMPVLNIQNSVNGRRSLGGTAFTCVQKELQRAQRLVKKKPL